MVLRVKLLIVLVLIASSLYITDTVDAHPGRIDSNGGHTCRTNCERWGYDYGEYHYHGGSGASSATTYTPPPAAAPTPTPAPVYTAPKPPTSSNTIPSTTTTPTSTPVSTKEKADYSWLWGVGLLGLFGWGWYADGKKKHKSSTPNTYYRPSGSVAPTLGTCPRCGGALRRINGRRGPFYGCSNFHTKNCRYTKSV